MITVGLWYELVFHLKMFCKITFHNQKIQFSSLAWNLAQIALFFQQLALLLPHAPMWKSVDSQTCKQILINFTYYFVLLLVNQCIIALSECVLPSAKTQQSLPMQWGKLKISFFVVKTIAWSHACNSDFNSIRIL